VRRWTLFSTANEIIQQLFDCETSLWTICDFVGTINPTLLITFFSDEKFNRTSSILLIDEIVEKRILVERIFISNHQSTRLVEYLNFNTMKIIRNETICFTQSFEDEYLRILQFYQQQQYSLLISIVEKQLRDKVTMIDIFGNEKLVTKLLRELEDLFKKYRRQKFPFIQLSKIEVNFYL
jgi:hypothetical protein